MSLYVNHATKSGIESGSTAATTIQTILNCHWSGGIPEIMFLPTPLEHMNFLKINIGMFSSRRILRVVFSCAV